MKGRRLPDTNAGHLAAGWEPGDYWRVLAADGSRPATPEEVTGAGDYSSNLTGGAWYVVTPNGVPAPLTLHTVREEDDGTISVRPGDGSSNSILLEDCYSWRLGERVSWHGYIEHGEWTAC